MPITAEFRQARLGCIILKMFLKVMQFILKEYISPIGLQMKFQLKDIQTALSLKEISLMEKLPNMDEFTIELCYKMLRNENVMPEPKCKWGNIPEDTEVEIADDIQRIHNITNEVINKRFDDISEEYYNKLLQEMKDIALRLDKHLHQDTYFKMYSTICVSDISPEDVLQELTLMKEVNGNTSTKEVIYARVPIKHVSPLHVTLRQQDKVKSSDDLLNIKLENNSDLIKTDISLAFTEASSNKRLTTQSLDENTSTTEEIYARAQFPVEHVFHLCVTLRQQLNSELSEDRLKECNIELEDKWFISDCIKIGNTLVFTEASTNKRLTIVNIDGTHIRNISLPYEPYYLTEVDNNTAAVSCTFDCTVLIINLSTGAVNRTIKTRGHCTGISSAFNNIYVFILGYLQAMDLFGNDLRTLNVPSFSAFDVSVQREGFVYIGNAAIYCRFFNGKKRWKFEKSKYKSFQHVTTDGDMNVYVTDQNTSTVVLISNDGKHYKELLNKSDGLYRPCGIYFDKKENILTVCNEMNDKVLLFDVKKKHKINLH